MSNLFLPSSMTGYARNRAESQYPECWDGVIGYWDFSVQGAIPLLGQAHDLSGYNNHGTLIADTHSVPGKYGNALDFDGTGDYITIPDSDLFSFGDAATDRPFSIVMWARIEDSDRARLIAKYDVGNSTEEWAFYTDGSDDLNFRVYDADNGVYIGKEYQNIHIKGLLNVWAQYGATYDGSGTTAGIHLYVNAVEVGAAVSAGAYTAMHNLGEPVIIGYRDDSDAYLNGQIDHIIIYNEARATSEIAFLHAHPKALATPRYRTIGKAAAPPAGIPILRRRIEAA